MSFSASIILSKISHHQFWVTVHYHSMISYHLFIVNLYDLPLRFLSKLTYPIAFAFHIWQITLLLISTYLILRFQSWEISCSWNFKGESCEWHVMFPMVNRYNSGEDAIFVIEWVWISLLRVNKDERRHSRTKGLSGLPHPHRISLCNCACIDMDKDHISHLFYPKSESCLPTGSRFASTHDLNLTSHAFFYVFCCSTATIEYKNYLFNIYKYVNVMLH